MIFVVKIDKEEEKEGRRFERPSNLYETWSEIACSQSGEGNKFS